MVCHVLLFTNNNEFLLTNLYTRVRTSPVVHWLALCFRTEAWHSAQGNEAKTVELAPSGFNVKSFPRQSRSSGGGIATVYKCTLCLTSHSKQTDFTHTSFEVVQASITLQHNTLHFSVCTALHQTDEANSLTLCLLNSCLTFSIT